MNLIRQTLLISTWQTPCRLNPTVRQHHSVSSIFGPESETGSLTSSILLTCIIAVINVRELRRVRTKPLHKSLENRCNKSRLQMSYEHEPRRRPSLQEDSLAGTTSTRHRHRTEVHSAHRRRRRKPVEELDDGGDARFYSRREGDIVRSSSASLRSPRRQVEEGRASFLPDILPVLRTLGLDTGARFIDREQQKPQRKSTIRRQSYDEGDKVVHVRTVRRSHSDIVDHASTSRPRVAR